MLWRAVRGGQGMEHGTQSQIGVTVITGYLGSGKTTLISGLLAHPDLCDTAVIVNEFGEVGLDHLLVESGSEDVVLLDSGCLCCTVNDSLGDTLADLMFRRARGEISAFRRVVIETSGLADPAPILHCLLTDRLVTQHYRLDGLVTVVDALHGLRQLDSTSEAVKQAAMADRLAISKDDVAGVEATQALRARLKEVNPRARILTKSNGAVGAPADLMDFHATGDFHLAAIGDLGGQEAPVRCQDEHRHGEAHGPSAHSDIGTCAFELARPATWAGYDFWVRRLVQFRGPDLLRMKGVLQIDGRDAPYFVQSVQHVFGSPAPMSTWPWSDRRGRLVFITRDIDRATLAQSLESLYEPAGIRRPVSVKDML